MKRIGTRNLLFVAMVALVFMMAGCGGSNNSSVATTKSVTLNPVLDFYINQTWYTDTDTLWGYGVDTTGAFTDGHTGSETGTSGARPYHTFHKLLYNINIAALNGATIQSAHFRVYLNGTSGADAPQNAILENIFYGNTDSFPPNPRNYDNEYGGYIVTPAITNSISISVGETGWKSFDVTAKLQADITAGRTNSQFRLSHANATNLLNYGCDWNMVDNVSNKPELVVVYTK